MATVLNCSHCGAEKPDDVDVNVTAAPAKKVGGDGTSEGVNIGNNSRVTWVCPVCGQQSAVLITGPLDLTIGGDVTGRDKFVKEERKVLFIFVHRRRNIGDE